jgi:hypothetical protein
LATAIEIDCALGETNAGLRALAAPLVRAGIVSVNVALRVPLAARAPFGDGSALLVPPPPPQPTTTAATNRHSKTR